ncbi:MAG: hypothetical protein H6672_09720 [Anaerolineaceae bacterium]|nr:hypothetical protein [Anaerolineaceae bacterium]
MDILQNVDMNTLMLLGVGLAVLCVVGLLLFFGLQLIGSVFSTLFGFIHLFTSIVTGGPAAWCGCLVLIFACLLCVGTVLLYSSCSANPSAMNFCALFPG